MFLHELLTKLAGFLLSQFQEYYTMGILKSVELLPPRENLLFSRCARGLTFFDI